jgi:hypothetical protein
MIQTIASNHGLAASHGPRGLRGLPGAPGGTLHLKAIERLYDEGEVCDSSKVWLLVDWSGNVVDSARARLELSFVDGYDGSRISGSERWEVGFSAKGVRELKSSLDGILSERIRNDLQRIGIRSWQGGRCQSEEPPKTPSPKPSPTPSPRPARPTPGDASEGQEAGFSQEEWAVIAAGGGLAVITLMWAIAR